MNGSVEMGVIVWERWFVVGLWKVAVTCSNDVTWLSLVLDYSLSQNITTLLHLPFSPLPLPAPPIPLFPTHKELQLSRDGCPMVGTNGSSSGQYDSLQAAMFTYAVPSASVYAVPTSNKSPAEVVSELDRRVEVLEEMHKQRTSLVMQVGT